MNRFTTLLSASMLMICLAFPTSAYAKPEPGVSGALSIIPGLGQVANGDALEGVAWFVSSIGLWFLYPNSYVNTVGFKIWEYNTYDAYRDAGAKETSKQTALQNYVAFMNPMNLVDPFSIGIVGYGIYSGASSPPYDKNRLGPPPPLAGAFFYGFVGWGEEAQFRGFLYPGLSYLLGGSHFWGAVASSAVFAAAHITNSQQTYHTAGTLGFLFAFGMLECWQVTTNHFDLRDNIFSHAWFDFSLDYVGQHPTGSGQIEHPYVVKMGIPLP